MVVNRSLVQVMKQIGLTAKHVVVYETLLTKPSSTPLQIAHETKLNRSSLYRYLEELRKKGLVELILGDKTCKYAADPLGLTQYLLSEEVRVENLKKTIPSLVASLARRNNYKESEVKYFRGVEGLKQMLWNVVSSGKEYVGLGYENWNTSAGKNFAEKLRQKNMEMGTKSREISNDPDDGFGYTELGNKYGDIYSHRRIEKKILEIKHDTYIYGDIFAYYYHSPDEYFGVEIHNGEIAKTEKQMFEILWKIAK